jgi:hypothetical protein
MDRPVRDKKPTKPLNYDKYGGVNPTPPAAAPKKRVLDRYHYEEVGPYGGSASFPASQPPPTGPHNYHDSHLYHVVKVRKVEVLATGKGKHTVFAVYE